jgi:hypothetical protein
MTDIEICQRDMLYQSRRHCQGVTWVRSPAKGLEEDFAMTIEIFYLTAQIQRWLNERVARHLAAQAAKLTH